MSLLYNTECSLLAMCPLPPRQISNQYNIHVYLYTATSKYGAALVYYLKAGAITSQHFEKDVPPNVWTPQVRIGTLCTSSNTECGDVVTVQNCLLCEQVYCVLFAGRGGDNFEESGRLQR